MVIVIGSIIATAMAVFFQPAVGSYFDSRRRAGLADNADTALRRIAREVHTAVPNSVRSASNQCFEFVPTIAGGRYRALEDTGGGSTPLEISQPLGSTGSPGAFDVLSPLSRIPAVGDWIVIDNQNAGDVYAAPAASGNIYYGNRARIGAINTTPVAGKYQARITLDSSYTSGSNNGFQFPAAYDGGRFVAVADNGGDSVVAYVCAGADGTMDAQGNGKGTLYRVTQGFNASWYPTSCPDTTNGSVIKSVVATRVLSCNFLYAPNQGATQQSGFVWMQLNLAESKELVSLSFGVHVDNLP